MFTPSMTVAAQPAYTIGAEAVKLLDSRLRHDNSPAKTVRLPAEVVHRTSCGCDHLRHSSAPRQLTHPLTRTASTAADTAPSGAARLLPPFGWPARKPVTLNDWPTWVCGRPKGSCAGVSVPARR